MATNNRWTGRDAWPDWRRALLLTVSVWCAGQIVGCASTSGAYTLPKYQPPPPGPGAAEVLSTAVVSAALKGVGGHLATLDGAETPSFATVLRVAPGAHKMGIDCLFNGLYLGGAFVESLIQHVVVTGTLVAGQKYYVRCTVDNEMPRAWLSDSPDAMSLPQGFESLCTRSCTGLH